MGERFTDGGYEIDFAEAVYDELDIPCMFPPSIKGLMETVVARSRIPSGFIDYRSATDESIRRAKALMEGIGWKLSDDGMEIYKEDPLEDGSDVSMAHAMIRRISYIDITAIINAHRDDGYIIAPNGKIYSPETWMDMIGEMKPYIRERIYDIDPPSHQAFADEYARQYREAFDEEWEPYRVSK